MEITRDLSKINAEDVHIAGGKGASLGEMVRASIPVPPGFVVLARVFDVFLEEANLNVEIDAILGSVNHAEMRTIEIASEKIQSLILQAEMSKEVRESIQASFAKLDSVFVAVRSSATAEDSTNAAWAGQLESYLNTTTDNLLENVQKCWASLFTPRAISYRFEKNRDSQNISVAVVVQKMVKSEKSGIAFSVHPVTQDKNQLIIEAGFGLGEAIASGYVTPDSYVVEKDPRRIIEKSMQAQELVLSEKEILEISELVLKIEKHFGFPCDIEWAMEKGDIFVVQSRPITTLSRPVPAVGLNILATDEFGADALSDLEGAMILVGKRHVKPFEASLRAQSWSEGLERELGFGYQTIVINSDGEYFVDSKSENIITKSIESKPVEVALEYIRKMNDAKNNLLKKIQEKDYSNAEKDFSDLYTFFFIARRISENVYEKVSSQDQKHIDEWRNDDTLFEPLDVYLQMKAQEEVAGEWSIVFYGGRLFHVDKKITWLENEAVEESADIIRGKIAYPGFVKGRVRLIFYKEDLDSVQDGEVLVTKMTAPEFVSVLQKVSAFITDEGGVTSHAAIAARELQKPCIIGTKNATKVLKDGDHVEVDAISGIVKILKG